MKHNNYQKQHFYKIVITASLLILSMPGYTEPSSEQTNDTYLSDLSMQDLFNIEVFSSTKSAKELIHAPSVMTVWTEHDIKAMGMRSIRELLERTTGFFPSLQYSTPIIGNRGFISDGNEAYLFLIDGHEINSLSATGAGVEYIVPNLNKVKRIEIVRGPGSTLWGGDAALALINIITKDGSDIDGIEVTAGYATEDKQRYTQINYGKNIYDDVSVMIAASHAEIYGFPDQDGGATVFPGPYQNPGYSPAANTSPEFPGQIGPIFALEDTWEIYTKVQLGNVSLSARSADIIGPDLWARSSNRDNVFWSRKRHTYLDFNVDHTINDSSSIETSVFSDYMVTSPHARFKTISPDTVEAREENLSKEHSIGLEILYRLQLKESHDIKVGARYVRTEIDPVITYLDLAFAEPGVPADGDVFLKVNPDKDDIATAIFIEDDWKISKQLSAILGVRIDDNNLREDTTSVLPRLGLVFQPTERWVLKYMFNTGYVRPPVNVGFLGSQPPKLADDDTTLYREIGADESEEVSSHDLQFAYRTDDMEISTTLYHTTLENFFGWSGDFTTDDGEVNGDIVSSDGELYRFAIINLNDIVSKGIEIEFKWRPTADLTAYANLSHVFSIKTDTFAWSSLGFQTSLANKAQFDNDRSLNGFPDDILNVGITYSFLSTHSVNLHARYWNNLTTLASDAVEPATYVELGSEIFVDINYRWEDIYGTGASVNLFAKNLFDNDDSKVGFPPHGGYWTDRARSIGAEVSVEF